ELQLNAIFIACFGLQWFWTISSETPGGYSGRYARLILTANYEQTDREGFNRLLDSISRSRDFIHPEHNARSF
ncbi:MAG TPA: hypothetical protein DEA96_17950, partial [Leptospiraceae bacterium]|nr:hypothetical protein [Leptospiraceae bacterium]